MISGEVEIGIRTAAPPRTRGRKLLKVKDFGLCELYISVVNGTAQETCKNP